MSQGKKRELVMVIGMEGENGKMKEGKKEKELGMVIVMQWFLNWVRSNPRGSVS